MSQLETRFTLDNTGFIQKMVENGTVTEREAARMTKSLKSVSDQMKIMQTASMAANDSGAGIKESSKHMEEFGFKTAGAKRELLVLAHEMSQGNYSKFGGSLLVLGERTGAASLLFSAMGLAALGATAAVGAFAFAALKGSEQTEDLRKSLILTGNAAGITSTRFEAFAAASAASAVTSLNQGRDALQALISTGKISQESIESATTATLLMEKLTGKSSEEIAKDFEKMGDGVAKWAQKHNDEYHYLSASQFKYIKGLEDQGKAEKAQAENFRLLAIHMAGVNKNLGTLETAWKKVKDAASGAWNAMLNIGRTASTGEQIAAMQKRLEATLNAPGGGVTRFTDAGGREVANRKLAADSIREAIAALTEKGQLENKDADITAKRAESDKKAIDKMMETPKAIKAVSHAYANLTEDVARYNEITKQTEAGAHRLNESEKWQIDMKSRLAKETENMTKKQREALVASIATAAAERARVEAPIKLKEFLGDIEKYNAESDLMAATSKKVTDYDRWQIEQKTRLAKVMRELNDAGRAAALVAITNASAFRKEAEEIKRGTEMEAEMQKKLAEISMKENHGTDTGLALSDAMGKHLRAIGDQTKDAEAIVSNSFKKMEDSVISFVKTGKLSFGDLWGSMAEDYLRELMKMAEKKMLLDSAGNFSMDGLSKGFGSVVGAIGGMFASGGATALAGGMDYVPYDGFPAILHKGERVQTAVQARSGGGAGGGSVFDYSGQTINVGQGVSRGEVHAAVLQGNAANEARIRRLIRNGNI